MNYLRGGKFFPYAAGLLLLLIFAVKFYQQFRLGILLSCTPDSVEPLTGALELMEGKGFGFQLNAQHYPSRYSPALALLVLPGVLLSGGNFSGAGVVIGFFGLLIPLVLFLLLEPKKHPGAGILFCGALTLYPCYSELCSMVMTEIPYIALLSLMLWNFLYIWRQIPPYRWPFFCSTAFLPQRQVLSGVPATRCLPLRRCL